jgi:hypothetical protein
MNNYFNKLNLVFHAIVGIPLALFVFLYLEIEKGGRQGLIEGSPTADMLSYVLPTISIVLAGVAFMMYRSNLLTIRTHPDFKTRLDEYSSALIKKYSMIEISSIIAIVGIYLTANVIYIAVYLLLLLYLSLHRPTNYRIVRDLKLKGEEKDMVLHKKELPE